MVLHNHTIAQIETEKLLMSTYSQPHVDHYPV